MIGDAFVCKNYVVKFEIFSRWGHNVFTIIDA